MAILINDNFSVQAPKPIDDRLVRDNYDALSTIPDYQLYVGLQVVTVDTLTVYIWDGSAWQVQQGGSIPNVDGANFELTDSSTAVSVNWDTKLLYNAGHIAVDWQNGYLYDTSTDNIVMCWNINTDNYYLQDINAQGSILWNDRRLNDSLGQQALSWDNNNRIGYNNSGLEIFSWDTNFEIYDTSGRAVIDTAFSKMYNVGILSIDWANRLLKDNAALTSLDWNGRAGYNDTGVVMFNWNTYFIVYDPSNNLSIDTSSGRLYTNGILSISWQSRTLFDTVGNRALTYGNTDRRLFDASTNVSMDYSARTLFDTTGTVTALNYNTRVLINASGANVMEWSGSQVTFDNGFTSSATNFISKLIVGTTTSAGTYPLQVSGNIYTSGAIFASNNMTSVDVNNRMLYDSTGILSINYTQRIIYDTSGTVQALNYNTRNFIDSTGVGAGSWNTRALQDTANKNSCLWGTRVLYDSTGTVQSVNWGSRIMVDASSIASLNYNVRNLYDSTGVKSIDYTVRALYNSSGVALATWSGALLATGSINLATVGNKLSIKGGTNATIGQATLVAGTVTVANTSVTANSLIWLTVKTIGGTAGNHSYTITAGTSFTINSSLTTDTSIINWLIIDMI